jgi:hypothetical protein
VLWVLTDWQAKKKLRLTTIQEPDYVIRRYSFYALLLNTLKDWMPKVRPTLLHTYTYPNIRCSHKGATQFLRRRVPTSINLSHVPTHEIRVNSELRKGRLHIRLDTDNRCQRPGKDIPPR